MPDYNTIPLFPLPIIVFPEEELRLHIFEPRYKQLIHECSEKGMVFGILPVLEKKVANIGSIMELTEIVKTYDDGRMDILLKCLGIFRLEKFIDIFPGKLYSAADISYIEINKTRNLELEIIIRDLFTQLCDLNNVKPLHKMSWEDFISYKLGHYVGFSSNEEYEFLNLITEKDRLNTLVQQINFMISQSKQRQNWLKQLNLNGEFRNFKEIGG